MPRKNSNEVSDVTDVSDVSEVKSAAHPVALVQQAPALPVPPSGVARAARAAVPAPLHHVQTFHILMGEWAARSSGNATTTAAMAPMGLNTELWKELEHMQAAIVRRLQEQQKGWMNGYAALAQEYQQGRRANTMSKFVEQQFNLVAQFGQLLSKQATDLVGLQENIEVDYGYWVSQKLQRQNP